MNMSDIPIYEQCKELEKENAESKALIAQRDESITVQAEIILNLKAEIERLKTYNTYACGNCHGKEDYKNLEKYNIALRKHFYKKVHTLQEIKAIAEYCMNKDTCYDCEYVDDCYIEDAEIPTYDICNLLIQKITKAEEE